ncbi:hypothetical protein ABT168_26890 [Streptomyces sp. NPDC001793]|uniref:hypothetical protein n=1 Tax=Streptomyces sp. NPDC001793 TaxID=3154657 RepID=UPI0033240FB4
MTTPTKDLTQFLAAFPEVLEERGEYGVPCPVHDDDRPSLFFRLKEDGRLLVRCWAGCKRHAILAALGMSARDLFDWVPGDGARVSAKPAPGDLDPGCLAAQAQYVDTTTLALGPGLDDRFPYRSTAYQKYARLTVRLHDFSGRPRGLQGRDLSGHCPARWLSISNPEDAAWSKYDVFAAHSGFDTVLITEGPGDALTAVSVGYDAVAIRGAGLARNDALHAMTHWSRSWPRDSRTGTWCWPATATPQEPSSPPPWRTSWSAPGPWSAAWRSPTPGTT